MGDGCLAVVGCVALFAAYSVFRYPSFHIWPPSSVGLFCFVEFLGKGWMSRPTAGRGGGISWNLILCFRRFGGITGSLLSNSDFVLVAR